jgi:hypothetical protein
MQMNIMFEKIWTMWVFVCPALYIFITRAVSRDEQTKRTVANKIRDYFRWSHATNKSQTICLLVCRAWVA